MRFYILLVSFLFLFISCNKNNTQEAKSTIDKPPTAEEINQIKKQINADQKSVKIADLVKTKVAAGFNGNILIAQKDIVLYEGAFGMADDTIPNTIASKFQLASLSKTFTAVATMKMVEEGKLGLDNTVQDYYPAFPYSGVTIRSLLCHRSGLPYYQYEFDKKVRSEKLFPSTADVLKWFSEAKPTPPVMNQADHYFSYNNTNYAVLAALIEVVSTGTFENYLTEKLLKPAGMTETYLGVSKSPEFSKNRTYGYQYGRKLPKDFYDDIMGDKGVYSTINDLNKWYKALKSEKILSKESLREMYTPRSFEHPGLRNYGYGFRLWVNDKQQTDYVYHTGWWKGYNTIMFFDLRDDFVIIVLSNKYNKNVYNIREYVDVLLDGKKNNNLEENILDQ